MELTPKLHPYLDAILQFLKDQVVEINFGFVKTTLKTSDADIALKNVIVAKIIDGRGDCLVVEKQGSKCFINVWQIQNIVPIENPLYVKDFYQDEHVK